MAVYDPRGGGNVHIDKVLTNISVGYQNNSFIAEELAPSVRVRKQSDLYYVYGREGWVLEPGSDVRAPGTEANEIPGLEVSTESYFAQEHALQIAVTDEERENADSPLSPDRDGTELVTDKLLLQRELIVRNLVQTAANYATGHSVTLAGTTQWSHTSSTPIEALKVGRRAIHGKIFTEPTKTIIPWQVMSIVEDHADFVERIKYSQAGVITADIIGTIAGISNIIVPGVGTNTARMGQTATLGYLWGDDVIMAYVPMRAGLKIPAFMYEFTWGYGSGQQQIVDRWREEKRGADVIRVRRRYDHKFMAKDGSDKSIAGYIMKDAIA